MNSPNKIASKFLPLDDFHIVEIRDLDEASIRGAAKRVQKDRAEIKHTTVLNFICKSLGFKGGFSEYKCRYWPMVRTFMDQNNLFRPGLDHNKQNESLLSISTQQIAERCFRSARPLPKRVFTGAGITWEDILVAASQLPDVHLDAPCHDVSINRRNCADLLKDSILPGQIHITSKGHRFSLSDFFHLENLLGDQLIQYREDFAFVPHPISTLYYPDDMSHEEVEQERAKNAAAGMLFARIIDSLEEGWLDVLPFNDALVFLRDQSGGYDYVFPRQQGNRFEHNIHAPFLKNADTPKSDDLYHFLRWRYFEDKGWPELDLHHAETEFYLNGGTVRNYPGSIEILRRFLIGQGRYQPPLKKAALENGFKKVLAGGKWLAVSNLVTVGQFREFMLNTNELYARYRPKPPEQDSWQECNGTEITADAPASVTWYDALAYVTVIAKIQRLPVRLASEVEWLDIAGELLDAITKDPGSVFRASKERLVERAKVDSVGFRGTSLARGGAGLLSRKTREGVSFVQASDLGEWLAPKGAAINSLHLGAMNMAPMHLAKTALAASEQIDEANVDWGRRVAATRDRMSPTSSGAYKNMRIGFRMVYELDV